MRGTLKACWTLFRVRSLESLQYRMAALANGSVSIFWALIEIVVFRIFYLYGNEPNTSGLSLLQLISYVWLAQAFLGLMHMNVDGELLRMITTGDIGIELCRPLDLYAHWFSKAAASTVGKLWWRCLITLLVAMLMPAAYRLGAPASFSNFALFLLAIFNSFLLCNAYGMLITAFRVGISWGDGPMHMLLIMSHVLSGGYLPLQLWPDFMQGFLLLQPFAGTLDIPMRLYIGSIPLGEALPAMGLQLFWTAAFIGLGRFIMKRRLAQLVVQGG